MGDSFRTRLNIRYTFNDDNEVERHNNVADTSSERNDGSVDGHHLFIVLL
jgi:hypothetical protein